MKLANTSKRVLPWFAVVCFLITSVLMIINLLRPEYEAVGYFYFHFAKLHIPIPILAPAVTNILAVIIFYLVAFIGAAILGISCKHCYFPVALGLLTLLAVIFMTVQEFLFISERSSFSAAYAYAVSPHWGPRGYLITQVLCKVLYCLPVCVLAVYMVIAPFCKFKGWVMPAVTVVVISLTLVATLVLSFPLDVMQSLKMISKIGIFGYEFGDIAFRNLLRLDNLNENTLKEILFTLGILFFQFTGLLLYLPVALHNPKTPPTEEK